MGFFFPDIRNASVMLGIWKTPKSLKKRKSPVIPPTSVYCKYYFDVFLVSFYPAYTQVDGLPFLSNNIYKNFSTFFKYLQYQIIGSNMNASSVKESV